MSPLLEVEVKWLARMDILAGRVEEEVEALLRRVPFLRVGPAGGGRQGRAARFEYKFSPGTLIVTGIYE